MLEEKLNHSAFPVFSVGDVEISSSVIDGPFGSQLKVEEYQESGVPLIRVSNCRTGEIVVGNELVYISEEKHAQLIRSEVLPGDVLVTKAGHILGYTAVFPESLMKGNITSHLASIRPSNRVVSAFLATYLASSLGKRQIYRWGNKATRPELNTDEVRALLVPLPSKEIQDRLVADINLARKAYKTKVVQANALLSGIDDFLLDYLGFTSPEKPAATFAIYLNQLQGPLNPERYRLLKVERSIAGTTVGSVANIVEDKISPQKESPDSEWRWIRIDELENEPIDISTVRTELGRDIEGTFFSVQENDILLARLGPTIQNSKFVLCPKTGKQTVASGEFLVLRCHEGWNPLVVLWVLRTTLYRDLIYSKGRGATPSRYRVNRDDLAALPFPQIEENMQARLAIEINDRLSEVRRLRKEADADWEIAKSDFEAKLLGEAVELQ